MVKVWSGRVARWGILALTALIVVVYFGRLFIVLERRVHVAEAQVSSDKTALAVANAKIGERDQALKDLHVTVTQPPAQVTVTMSPGAGQSTAIIPGSSRVVTIPSPFAVPGPTVTMTPSKSPITVTVTECPVLHLLFICL